MATEYTPNYNLDLYVSTDKPNLRDQYNAAMGKIDTQMKANADGVTNANANVVAAQTQITQNKEDIAALESTVETHGTQITNVQNTADDAFSLAQTNESDIASVETDVTQLKTQMGAANTNIESLQSTATELNGQIETLNGQIATINTEVDGKAPTDHSSAAATFGLGNAAEYGHVKLTDTPGSQGASSGVAASPLSVYNLMQDMAPKLYNFGTKAAGNIYGSLCVNEAIRLCVLRVSFLGYTPAQTNVVSDSFFTVPEQYRPTHSFGALVDVNLAKSATTSLRFLNPDNGNGANDGKVCYVQYCATPIEVTQDCELVWFYGAQPASL